MPRLDWNTPGNRAYESGVDRGVLYPQSGPGVAWVGITGVSESPSGAAQVPYYIDGLMYRNRISTEEYAATLTAYSFPDEFIEYDGNTHHDDGLIFTLQPRRSFDFSYRTGIGNDILGLDLGYKINLVYNVLAVSASKSHTTLGSQNSPIQYSWTLSARPIIFSNLKPTPHLVIDSTRANPTKLASLEEFLYGTDSTEARMPSPDEVVAIFSS